MPGSMTSHRKLRELLFRASLVAVPATMACCGGESVRLFASRARYATQIDACVADPKQCDALCYDVLETDKTASMYDTVDVSSCAIVETKSDGVTLAIDYDGSYECGRRPRGLREPIRASPTCGAWLAKIATLEAASVTSFARLVRQLGRIGAPAWAIASARAAIADELLHARLASRLARALGATVAPPVIEGDDETTLAELARDNAVEGQVGETFGALLAMCQARTATSPVVRSVFARIAHDETRHAELAHRLASWLAAGLTARERANISAAARERADALCSGHDDGLGAADRAWLGIPPPRDLAAGARVVFHAATTSFHSR